MPLTQSIVQSQAKPGIHIFRERRRSWQVILRFFIIRQVFQQKLIEEACSPTWDAAGDFEVLMPLLLHPLGHLGFLQQVLNAREEVLFNPRVRDAGVSSIESMTRWADREVAAFRQRI